MLPITTAMALPEPQRSDALELIVLEHMQVGVMAVLPKGDKRKGLNVSRERDRTGRPRRMDISASEPEILPAAVAIRLLGKYGKDAGATRVDAAGAGIPESKRAYLIETPLPQNDGYSILLGARSEDASQYGVLLLRADDPELENDTVDFLDAVVAAVPDDEPAAVE